RRHGPRHPGAASHDADLPRALSGHALPDRLSRRRMLRRWLMPARTRPQRRLRACPLDKETPMNAIPAPDLPVAVIGAGPVGLAAAARLVERGLRPAVFEKGTSVGAAIREWGHVRVFSPWDYNVDEAARSLLAANGVAAPAGKHLPTGAEIVRDYLEPLSRVPAIAEGLRLGAEVTGITRLGHDLMFNDGRADAPFVVRYRDAAGEQRMLARAVIDASGTWCKPNPMGVDGLPGPEIG